MRGQTRRVDRLGEAIIRIAGPHHFTDHGDLEVDDLYNHGGLFQIFANQLLQDRLDLHHG